MLVLISKLPKYKYMMQLKPGFLMVDMLISVNNLYIWERV